MPTIYRVKGLEIFLEEIPNDNFVILFLKSLKTKGGLKENFFILQL
jgi:hypothetical protein